MSRIEMWKRKIDGKDVLVIVDYVKGTEQTFTSDGPAEKTDVNFSDERYGCNGFKRMRLAVKGMKDTTTFDEDTEELL